MRAALIDLAPLRRSRDFRRLWWTSTVSVLGAQVALFAVLLQVWELTRSPVWTGAIGLAHAVPMIAVSLVGGALADSVDRRTLVLVGSAGQLLSAALLALQAVLGNSSVLLVLGLVAVHTVFAALSGPARRTFVPRLLPPDLVPAGLALTHISFQGAMLVGPTLAGVVVAVWGLSAAYALDALTFAVAMYGVWRLPGLAPEPATGTPEPGSSLRRALGGVRFLAGRPVLRGAFLTDLAATLLAMPVALFPMVNEQRFGGSPQTLGLFLSSVAVGGVVVSLVSGSYTRLPRQGVVMLVAAATWGAALAAFGLVDGLVPTVLTLAVAGAADTVVSVVCRATITQLATPDALRGRVSAAEIVVSISGPDLGNVRGGVVAGLTSAGFALTTGGLACVACVAAIAWRVPAVRRFDLRQPVAPA